MFGCLSAIFEGRDIVFGGWNIVLSFERFSDFLDIWTW